MGNAIKNFLTAVPDRSNCCRLRAKILGTDLCLHQILNQFLLNLNLCSLSVSLSHNIHGSTERSIEQLLKIKYSQKVQKSFRAKFQGSCVSPKKIFWFSCANPTELVTIRHDSASMKSVIINFLLALSSLPWKLAQTIVQHVYLWNDVFQRTNRNSNFIFPAVYYPDDISGSVVPI